MLYVKGKQYKNNCHKHKKHYIFAENKGTHENAEYHGKHKCNKEMYYSFMLHKSDFVEMFRENILQFGFIGRFFKFIGDIFHIVC